MAWDTLSVQEKHDIAAEMIEAVDISHNSDEIEIVFGIRKYFKNSIFIRNV